MSTSEGDSAPPNEPTTVEVEVDVHTKEEESKEDLTGGIQLDPIRNQLSNSPESITEETAGEENDDIAPLATPLATASGRSTNQSSATSDQESKKERGTVIVRMKSSSSTPGTPKSPKSPDTPKSPGTGLSRRKSSFLRQDSNLSFQDSWRKRDATVRQKSSKNFVSFHNIYYTVPQGRFWEHKPPKVILNDVR